MVAAEAAAAGSLPLVANHSGLAEIAAGRLGRVPGAVPRPDELHDRRLRRPRREAARLLASSRTSEHDSRRPRGAQSSSAGAGRASRGGCSSRLTSGRGRGHVPVWPFGNQAVQGRREGPYEYVWARLRTPECAAFPGGQADKPACGRDHYPLARGRRARPEWRRTAAARPRALRVCDRLHARRRGGVRDPRPGDPRAHGRLRAAPARGQGHRARAAPRGRADRVRGRDPNGPLRDLRRRGCARPEAARPAQGARRRARLHSRARRARIRGARGRSSGSSTRRTIASETSFSATSSGGTTRSASTSMSRSTAPTAPSRSATPSAPTSPSCSRSPRARRSSST